MRRILYFLIPALVLGGVIAWRVVQNKHQETAQAQAAKARKTAAPSVRVATAIVRNIVHEYQGVGNVESTSDVRIAAKVTGRVDYLEVREGDPVQRGQVLARLDPAEIQASINQQQANVVSARASMLNAQIRYNRTYDVYRQGFTAAQDVDDARAQVMVARGAYNAANAQLRNLQAQLSNTILRAPINGYVTARYLDPGSVVTAGQPIIAVQTLRNIYVTTSVPEEIHGNIHVGIGASAVFDGIPGRTFQGKVTHVDPAADPQSRQFLVRASFSNQSHLIRPGMFCRITMITQVTHNAVVVPREAVQNSPRGQTVTVVDNKLVAHPRLVRTGDQDTVGIAIVDGVKAGETVVTLSSQPVREGQVVKIDPGAGPTQSAGQPTVAGGGGGAPLGSVQTGGGGASAPTYSIAPGGGSQSGSSATSGSAGTSSSGAATSSVGSGAPSAGSAARSSVTATGVGGQGSSVGAAAPGSSAAPAMTGGTGAAGASGGIGGAGAAGGGGSAAGGTVPGGSIGTSAVGGSTASGGVGAAGGAGR